jgi:hypothetical protein
MKNRTAYELFWGPIEMIEFNYKSAIWTLIDDRYTVIE